jgi:hypothetical protein
MPATAHFAFGIFNLAIPNILVWVVLIAVFFVAAWTRLPRIFESGGEKEQRSQ